MQSNPWSTKRLLDAVERGDTAAVRTALDQGADPNAHVDRTERLPTVKSVVSDTLEEITQRETALELPGDRGTVLQRQMATPTLRGSPDRGGEPVGAMKRAHVDETLFPTRTTLAAIDTVAARATGGRSWVIERSYRAARAKLSALTAGALTWRPARR